jgi:hypothetical protein
MIKSVFLFLIYRPILKRSSARNNKFGSEGPTILWLVVELSILHIFNLILSMQ